MDKNHQSDELIIANKKLVFQNVEKEKRAAELVLADKELAFQNAEKEKLAAELVIANKELVFQNKEKEKRAAELIIANKELVFQNEEKEKRAAELVVANKELVFQNREKEKRAAELIIANKELVFQNEEKEKRAAELVVANKELVFQNREKEKRAAELIIFNKELVFQNEEKEKRAAELDIANKELVFQNEEKEKRAAELVLAYKLVFQNEEKAKRAAELDIANKELVFQNEEKEKRAAELDIANKELVFQNQEREKRAAELRSARLDVSEFVSMASHEFRTPLSTVFSSASLISKYTLTKEQHNREKHIERIKQSVTNINEILENFLNLGKLEQGRDIRRVTTFNLNELIDSIINELKSSLKHGQEFKLHIKGESDFTTDKNLLTKILVNLLNNAIKFSSENQICHIDMVQSNGMLTIRIKDNGIGMDTEDIEHVFSSFHRGKNAINIQGIGLGLHIVKRYLNILNGHINFSSKINEGTTIDMELPDLKTFLLL